MTKYIKIFVTLLFITTLASCGKSTSASDSITEISATELTQESLEKYLIIDVREPHEFATGSIKNAVLMPMGVIQTQLPEYLNKHFSEHSADDISTKPILLYCRSGRRSAVAANMLQQMGLRNVVSLKGGIIDWSKSKP